MYSRNNDRSNEGKFDLDPNAHERLNQIRERDAAKFLSFSTTSFGQFATAAPRYDNGIEPSSPVARAKHSKYAKDTSKDDSLSIKDISRDYCGF